MPLHMNLLSENSLVILCWLHTPNWNLNKPSLVFIKISILFVQLQSYLL